jgi:predicted nucleic acid-binding protein
MILVDTSIWVEHLRSDLPQLARRLEEGTAATHPWVIGELACGNLRNRQTFLGLLSALPHVSVAKEHEVLFTIESRRLMGQGIGFIDAHLLTSAMLSKATIWTQDRRLSAVADDLGLLTPANNPAEP